MLRILITGPGRSGTTLLARALHAAGHDFGRRPEAQPDWIPRSALPDGGMEDGRLGDLWAQLRAELRCRHDAAQVARIHGERISALFEELPEAAKYPGLVEVIPVLVAAGVLPQIVLVTLRDVGACARSIQRVHVENEAEARMLAELRRSRSLAAFNQLQRAGVDARLAIFPLWAERRSVWQPFAGDLAPWKTVKSLYDSDLVHFR